MGPILAPVLAIGQLALGAVTAFAQIGQANAMYQAQQEAANRQIEASYKEISRQQEEVNRIAVEQKSDRIRQANAELGTVRVSAGERGVSGGTMMAYARAIGALEGMDISRIEKNRESNIKAGEAAKVAAQNQYFSTLTIAANQTSAAKTSAFLGFVGSGLQIGSGLYKQSSVLGTLSNPKV